MYARRDHACLEPSCRAGVQSRPQGSSLGKAKAEAGRMMQPPLREPVLVRLGRWGAVVWTIMVALSVLVAYLGVLVLAPAITVDEPAPLDPLNPLPIIFMIKNTGFITLYSVQPSVGLCRYEFSKTGTGPPNTMRSPAKICGGSTLVHLSLTNDAVDKFARDEKIPIRVDEVFREYIGSGRTVSADISILIDFDVWFIPWWPKEFRYATRREF